MLFAMNLKNRIKAKEKARTIDSVASYQATVLIAVHGIKKAERVAELILQKIRAQKK